ncbi:MAG: hypothetical protein AB1656_09450 [Candidatus Omnitrophota bacterium]
MRRESELVHKNEEEKQPQEWETLLEDITVERNWREAPWDPSTLANLHETLKWNELMDERIDLYSDDEKTNRIRIIQQIAERKLNGTTRQCFLLYLNAGLTQKRIGELLRVHEDTARRSIERGIEIVRECLKESPLGEFPAAKGRRPVVRVRIFPLDNRKEKEEFQRFLNDHAIIHISYSGERLFREAMAVYLTGKPGSRKDNTPIQD